MYKKWMTILFVLVLGTEILMATDQMQWADRVIGFSSEASYSAYSSKQVLGPPNKLPSFGDAGTAWTPGESQNGEERYIKVGFEQPIKIKQVVVAESFQAGSVDKIILFDRNNREFVVYNSEKDGREVIQMGQLLTVTFQETRYKVHAAKVVLKNRIWKKGQIDAIGISASEKPWEPSIRITEKFSYPGEITPVGITVNSSFAEIMPRLSPDGSTMYLCRKNHPENYGFSPNDDIWITNRQSDGSWSQAENAGWPLNNENHNYVCGVSEEGEMLTLGNGYRFDRKPMSGVSQTVRSGKNWVEPLNLRIDGLSILNMNAEYYMNRDRNVLVLAIESWSSMGDKDLFVSFSEDQIHWSKPISMGPKVNSAGKEMAPYISEDGESIFYSSNGFPGYGDHDIYVSHRLDESWTNWSEPENLGESINSPEWDSYFYYSERTGEAFFSSTRGRLGNEDIYVISMSDQRQGEDEYGDPLVYASISKGSILNTREKNPSQKINSAPDSKKRTLMLFGGVYDARTGGLIHANLHIASPTDKSVNLRQPTGKTIYKLSIKEEHLYQAEISAPGYFAEKRKFTGKDKNGKGSMRMDFELIPIIAGQIIKLDDIYFDVNSDVLQPASYETLDRWVELLHQQAGVSLQVQGHTNNRCSAQYCTELSRNRSRAVSEYLISNGISEDRL
ncbi:MAG: OOP family OmpA-OmpF porin, partial [Limisphaerales bacterium]